jgi:hypothetical protein
MVAKILLRKKKRRSSMPEAMTTNARAPPEVTSTTSILAGCALADPALPRPSCKWNEESCCLGFVDKPLIESRVTKAIAKSRD